MTRRAQNALSFKNEMVLTAEQQRAQRTRRNYGKNAIGKLVRKKAFRDCDYTADGHLQQFTDEAGVIAFEEERYTSGQHQAHYSTEAKETVPREQLALEYVATMEAMRNKLASKEGHQTRVHQEQLAEGLHERLDHLQEIAEGKACEQLKLEEKKLEIAKAKAEAKAEAKAIENEAFTQRVEAGNGTQLEEKQLQLKILAEDIRQHKAELALEKARKKAERKATAPRPPAQVSDKDLRREIEKGHRADYWSPEVHNWSTLVRVKTAEACIKPALPKSLHAIGGQKAKVVSEDGDTLRVKAPLFGDKTFSVRRDFVEFLPPDTEMPPPAERPRAKVRKTAEPAPAPAAPHPPAAGEDCFDERATAFDERAAASDTASHGTVAAPATAEPADSGAAKRSRKEEPTSSKVLLRKLLPRWADALAKGEKLVEFVSYTTGQRNAMKRFTAGTVMVVSTSGSRSVAAVAVAAGQAVVRQRAQDISAALDLVPVSLRAGVQEYLSGKATFDYVVFSHCYDLRPLGVQLEQFYDRFDIAAPRCLSGFPALESSSPGLAERVLQWCWDLGAEQHCRANSIAPSPANKQHQPSSGAPKVPGSRSPQQVGPRDLEAPATPVKSQPTASQCTQDSQFTQNEPSECSSPGVSDDEFNYSFKDAKRRSSDRPATDPTKRNGRSRRGRDADAANSTRQKKSER